MEIVNVDCNGICIIVNKFKFVKMDNILLRFLFEINVILCY